MFRRRKLQFAGVGAKMKKIIIICLAILCLCSCEPKKLSGLQQNNIKAYLGDVDFTKGIIWFYDLNEDGKDEIIIPFGREFEQKYFKGFGYSIKVFDNTGKLLKSIGFPAWVPDMPSVHAEKLSVKYPPVLFCSAYDRDRGGVITRFWTLDGKIDGEISNTNTPEEISFYQFDRDVPTCVEVYFGAKCTYTIYKMDPDSKNPVIKKEDLTRFEKLLKKAFPQSACSPSGDFEQQVPAMHRGPLRPQPLNPEKVKKNVPAN